MCSERAYALNVGINLAKRRMEVLKVISGVMVKKGESPLSSYAGCSKLLRNNHRDFRKGFAWENLED